MRLASRVAASWFWPDCPAEIDPGWAPFVSGAAEAAGAATLAGAPAADLSIDSAD
jgi:hypothetical protein